MATKEKEPGTNLDKLKTTALAAPIDFGEASGEGFENDTSADVLVPFLKVIQSNSREMTDESLDGIKAGMFFNTMTKEMFPGNTGVPFIPTHKEHVYLRFVPIAEGGGFRGKYSLNDPFVREAKIKSNVTFGSIPVAAEGGDKATELIETFIIYALQLNDDGEITGPVVISLAKTKIGAYKEWWTSLKTYMHPNSSGRKSNPPVYAHRCRITSKKDQRDSGPFQNVVIGAANGSIPASIIAPSDPRFIAAQEFATMVKNGIAAPDFSEPEAAGASGNEGFKGQF